jgi:hypothetical protein
MKTHYATVERANESDNNDYWSETVCGTESEHLENDWNVVDCKKCLKCKVKFEIEMKQSMEDSVNYMIEFMEFGGW